jgi:hypothetical protein
MSSTTRQYQRRRYQALSCGQWQPWANPKPVRAHVHYLRHQGGTYAAIARAAGVSAMTIHAIANGQGRIRPAVAAALLAISIDDLHRPRVHAGGTRLRLRSLMAMGHDCTRIARAAGTSPAAVRKLAQGRAPDVTPGLQERVRSIWDAWWDKTPPQRTPADRAAATRARNTARRRNWCTPLGLDEDLIDCIGYQPSHGWLPATGTGTAPDLAPPHRGQGKTADPPSTSSSEEGTTTMPFDPVPRPASEYQKGAAFAHQMFMRQLDAGVDAGQIAARHAAAVTTLTGATRNDSEQEFLRGFTATGADHLATLRDLQQAEAGQHHQDHDQEREAG